MGSFSRFCVFSSMTLDPVWGMSGQEKKKFSSFAQSPFAKAAAGQGLRRTGIKKEVGFSRIWSDLLGFLRIRWGFCTICLVFCKFIGVLEQLRV